MDDETDSPLADPSATSCVLIRGSLIVSENG